MAGIVDLYLLGYFNELLYNAAELVKCLPMDNVY